MLTLFSDSYFPLKTEYCHLENTLKRKIIFEHFPGQIMIYTIFVKYNSQGHLIVCALSNYSKSGYLQKQLFVMAK